MKAPSWPTKLGGRCGINWFWEYYATEAEARQALQLHLADDRPRGDVSEVQEEFTLKQGFPVPDGPVIPAGAWCVHVHF
jgi:hypothetical protein